MNRIFFALKPYILACLFLLGFTAVSYGQCPTAGAVITKTHTDISCFGANDGTITVELGDGAAPLNFELFDNVLGTFVTLAVTEINDPDGNGNFRKVRYEDVYSSSFQVVVFKTGCLPPLQISETPFGFFVQEPTQLAVTVDAIDPDCDPAAGTGDGGIDITASGGTAPYTYAWSDGSSAEDRTNLDAGSYTVTITDNNGCSINQVVNVPVTTQANAGPPTGLTCGTNSFALSGNSAGAGEIGTWTGPPGVTFSPNANDPNATANNLNAGANVLTWTITDTGGLCTGTSDNIIVTYSPTMVLTPAITNVDCNGNSTGAIDLTITSGGIAPFTYLWSNGAVTEDLTNIPAGTYSVTVTDASTCTATLTNIIVTQPPVLTLTPAPGAAMTLDCNGDTDGAGSFTAGGGTPGYTFLVTANTTGATTSTTATAVNFTGAGIGSISVQVTDANGCVQSSTIVISQPPVLTLTPTADIALTCNGDTNGAGSFTAGGGTPGYTFTVLTNTTGATTSTTATALSFTGGGVGAITVRVTDASGCIQDATINITAPPLLTLTPTANVLLDCAGDTDGTGSFTAGGGTPGYTFLVTANTTGATTTTTATALSFTGGGAGSISVRVTDANGCIANSTITITAPPALTLTPSGNILLGCNGDTDGAGSFTAGGGTPGYTFLVTGNTTGATTSTTATALNFTGGGVGSISVQVTDASGCVANATITITQPPVLTLTPTADIALTCNGDTNGAGSFTAGGGTPGYTFTVLGNTTGATTSTTATALNFTGGGVGAITVRVTDASGCTEDATINITAPPLLTLTPSANVVLDCAGDTDGTGSFTAGGGTPNYTFLVTANTTGATTTTTATALNFTGGGAGAITVRVTDANGCIANATITITAPPALTLTTSGNILLGCNGDTDGAGSFTAGGGTPGYTFLVTGNTTGATTSTTATALNFTGGGVGSISVQVTDASGCVANATITITQPPVLTLTPSADVVLGCNGDTDGTGSFTAGGGTPGYTFLVTANTTGATTSTTATALNFTGGGVGSISVQVTDASGCVANATINITAPPVLTLTPSADVALDCFGDTDGTGTFTAGGGTPGYTFLVTGNTTGATTTTTATSLSFTGGGVGAITVQVTDAGGCIQSATINITAPADLTLTTSGDITLDCNGDTDGAGTFTAGGGTPGYTFLVTGNTTGATTTTTATALSFTGGGVGAISVQVTDLNGCTETATINITAPPVLTLTPSGDITLGCNGDTDGAGSFTAAGGTAGYTFLVTGNTTGATTTTTATALNFTGAGVGAITVQVTDANGCTTAATINVTAPPALTLTPSADVVLDCFGDTDGAGTFTAGGGTPGYTFLVTGNTTGATTTTTATALNFTGGGAGAITVQVTDASGCTTSATINITQPAAALALTPSADITLDCFGDTDGAGSFTATGGTVGYTFLVTGNTTGATTTTTATAVNFTGGGAGAISVQVTDANGCTASATINITAPAALTLNTTGDIALGCNGDTDGAGTFTAGGGTPGYTFVVTANTTGGTTTTTATTVDFTGAGVGLITVQVTDANGCVTSSTINVTAPPALVLNNSGNIALTCFGDTDGVGTFSVVGGTAPYIFNVLTNTTGATTSTTATTLDFTNAGAGQIIVSVSDANGCSVQSTINVTEPAQIVGTISGTASICNGQSANITVSFTGGTGPWFFTYSDGVTTSVEIPSFFSSITFPVMPTTNTTYTLVSVRDNTCTGTGTGSAVITVNTPPDASLAVAAAISPLCSGGSTDITVANSQLGVSYQLRNDADDSNIGTPVVGTGGTISLPTGTLTTTTVFNVLATATGCTSVELTAKATVNVSGSINAGVAVNPLASPICSGNSTSIRITGSQTGVMYQLRNNADDSPVGTAVAGTGGDIDLPTGTLTATTVYNILANNGTCSIELTTLATVQVDPNPNATLTVSVVLDPLCSGGTTDIRIDLSEVGVNYQLRNDADDSNIGAPVAGTGGTIFLNTGTLTTTTTFNILASTGGTCADVELTTTPTVNVSGSIDITLSINPLSDPVCEGTSTFITIVNAEAGVTYQLRDDADDSNIGPPVVGAGVDIDLPTGNLAATTTFNVLANNGTCSIQMTNLATVNVEVNPVTTLPVDATINPLCTGGISAIRIQNSQTGVIYQLRNDFDDSPVGTPVAGTGGTILLSTGVLNATTTFNVLASSGGTCPDLEMATIITITVGGTINNALNTDPSPTTPICTGEAAFVVVQGSETGVTYQLRNEADDSNVGLPVPGTGADINLPTGNLTATTTFNVLASNGVCSIELTDTETITVNAGPGTTPAISASPAVICAGNVSSIVITNPEVGVTYQVRRNADDTPVGGAVTAPDTNPLTIALPQSELVSTASFNVLATLGTCSVELGPVTVTVRPLGDPLCTPIDDCGYFTIAQGAGTARPSCGGNDDGVVELIISASSSPVNNYAVSLFRDGVPVQVPQQGPSGTMFRWDNLSPGEYEYRINDFGGHICVRQFSFQVETTVKATASGFVDASCFGQPTGQAVLTITDGASPYQVFYSGTWHDGYVSGNVITDLPPDGTYNILVRDNDSDACPAEVQVTINNGAPQITATFDIEPATCGNADGAILITDVGGGSGSGYLVSIDGVNFFAPDEADFSGLTGGGYNVIVQDGNLCTATFPVNVTFPGFINFDVDPVPFVNCGELGGLEVYGLGIGTYQIGYSLSASVQPETFETFISQGPTDKFKIENLFGGEYFVFVQPPGGQCPTRQSEFVDGDLAVSFEPIVECVGGEQLRVRLTELQGADGNVSVSIIDQFGIEVNSGFEQLTPGGEILLSSSAYDFILNPDPYKIKLTQITNICPVEAEESVVIPEPISAVVTNIKESYPDLLVGAFTVTKVANGGDEVPPYQMKIELEQAAVGGQSFETDFEDVGQNNNLDYEMVYAGLPAGLYNIYITDGIGCNATMQTTVPLNTDIYVPNLFTPNNDGHNEVFFIRNIPEGGAKVVITNRWGKQVYKSDSYQNDWAAEGVTDGIYFYQIQPDGGDPLTGWVEVLRGNKP